MTLAISGAKVNVVGLGATGLSLVRFLSARGAQVSVLDGNENAAGREVLERDFPKVKLTRIDVSREQLPACDWVALSPGVPRASHAIQSAVETGLSVIGDIEIFAHFIGANAQLIGITGSNGKTTTAQLTGALLESAGISCEVVGNVGVPVLDALSSHAPRAAYVLELSSFQLESTASLKCAAATVLNVTDNHLDRYPSFFEYAAAKAKIFALANAQVINRDDAWSQSMRRPAKTAISFGASAPNNDNDFGLNVRNGQATLVRGSRPLIETNAMKLRGTHNAMNALAACALASTLTADTAAMSRALSKFEGLPHRYQWLGSVNGVDVINDSKATTTIAAGAALEGTQAPVWLIAGGDAKAQSFSDFAKVAAKRCCAVQLIGRDAAIIADALSTQGVAHRTFSSLQDAVHDALSKAQRGDVLLLSPACASWDMFKNYEARAVEFERAVTAWAHSHGTTLVKEAGHA